MTSCDQIRVHLLEHLYNLLEEEDGRALDVHRHARAPFCDGKPARRP